MRGRDVIVVVGLTALLQAPLAWSKGSASGRCAAVKRAAVGLKVAQKLGCQAVAARSGHAVDRVCLAKAEQKFAATMAHAEQHGGCATTGDADALEARVDAFVLDIVTAVPAQGSTTTTTTTTPGTTTTTTLIPPPPMLGTQLDRAGREGVSLLLVDPFDAVTMTRTAAKEQYNAAPQSAWLGNFAATIQSNLGLWDGLDRLCGNQVLAAAGMTASRYASLASVLADDRIYVRTTAGMCRYLAVEEDATGLVSDPTNCGGRTPGEDAIDITYSLLIVGTASGVSDGVASNDASTSATFPFLAPPH
jgi:hypothetical protein